MKRLSERAFTMLLSKYGDGPTLSSGDHCIHCPSDGVKTMIRADDCMDRRSPFKEIVDASPAGKTLKGTLLLQWSLRRNVNFPSEADIGPTTSIRCPHGELVPEQAAGAKRVLIPEDLCLFLYEQSNKLKPEDPLACSTFPSDAETCGICSVELNNAKLKERQNHNKLLQGNNDSLSPGSKYYLVPSWWLSKWKSYIRASGKMVSSPAAARPDPLEGVIDSLVCSTHSRLLERPPIVICKRGHIFQKPYTTDGLTLISENDWKFFCEDWQGANSKCVSAEFEFSGADAKKLIGSSEEVPISEAKLNASNDEVEPRQPTIKTYPTICEECIGERERRELMQKSSYCNEEISVVPVRGIEDPRSVLEASWAVSEPDSHTSKCLTNLNGDVLEADNSSPALIDNTSVPCSHGQGAWTTLLFKAHGTTTVGLQHPNFGVVVGADGKTSCIQTLTLVELDQCKINHFGGGGGVDQFKMSGAWAGEVERCEEISAQVHQLVDDATNEADKVKFIRERLMALDGGWGYIFGEIEKKGGKFCPFLFFVKPRMSDAGEGFYCYGSGMDYAAEVLSSISDIGKLTLEEAIAWVERALVYEALMDHFSGGISCIHAMGINGYTETRTEGILTTLRKRHKSYFKERRALYKKYDFGWTVCEFGKLTKKSKVRWMNAINLFKSPCQWMLYEKKKSDYWDESESDTSGIEHG